MSFSLIQIKSDIYFQAWWSARFEPKYEWQELLKLIFKSKPKGKKQISYVYSIIDVYQIIKQKKEVIKSEN